MKQVPKAEAVFRERTGILVEAVLLVIKGLRQNSIQSKPILLMDPKAENYESKSLEEVLWEALGKCGITEKK